MGQNEPGFGSAIRRLLHPVALCVVAVYLGLLLLGRWVLGHGLPDSLTLSLLGHAHTVAGIHRRLLDRALEAGILLPGVFLAEYLWMGWQGSSLRHLMVERTASARSDIACYLLLMAPGWTLVCGVMTLGVVYVSGEGVRHLIGHAVGVEPSIAGLPLAIQVVILFLIYTLADYWSHRLDHSRVFWPLHRFHHAAESFAVVTASRVHPAAFTTLVGVLPGVLLGPSPFALLDVGIAVAVIRLVIHSRIESDFGWAGRWLVLSPLHHRLHHSLGRMPVNLGLIPLWDRLFRTLRAPPAQAMKIGVPQVYRHGAWVGPDIWRDYCEFGVGVVKLATTPARRRGGAGRKRASAPGLRP